MKSNKEIGQIGEDAAVIFLEQLGYNILERNWRFSRAEIDIAASQYMNLIKYDWEIRFDIISILILKNQELQIKHFKDAWF